VLSSTRWQKVPLRPLTICAFGGYAWHVFGEADPPEVDTTAATTLRSCSTAMKSRPAAVIFILVTVTLDILAMGLIIPVLPKLILDFLGAR